MTRLIYIIVSTGMLVMIGISAIVVAEEPARLKAPRIDLHGLSEAEENPGVVTVDCDAGERIGDLPIGPPSPATTVGHGDDDDDDDAGIDPSSRLIVEVSGTCVENITIGRSNVTVRGTSSGDAEIIGGNGGASAIRIQHATGVRLEQLKISNDDATCVDAFSAAVTLDQVVLAECDSGLTSRGSSNLVLDSRVENNARGVRTSGGDFTRLQNVELIGNEIAIFVLGNAHVSIIDGSVRDNGVAFSAIWNSLMTQGGFTAFSNNGRGGFVLYDSQFRFQGQLTAIGETFRIGGQSQGSISVGAVLDVGDGILAVDGDSSLLVEGTVEGDVQAVDFSKITVTGRVIGRLTCGDIAAAACLGEVQASNCPGCPATLQRSGLAIRSIPDLPPEIEALIRDPRP